MIITCKSCHKRYFLEEGSIYSQGRRVRCVACHHTWIQLPLEPEGATLSLNPLDDFRRPGRSHKSSFQPEWRWALFLGMIFMILGGGYLARVPLVSLWPASSLFYEKLGIHVERPGAGLVFQNVTSLQQPHENPPQLVLRGEIWNVSKQARRIGSMTVILSGSCGQAGWISKLWSKLFPSQGMEKGHCRLDKWSYSLKETRLLPGERLAFETPPRPISPGTSEVLLEF